MKTCPMCGKDSDDSVKFCSRCGTPYGQDVAKTLFTPSPAHELTPESESFSDQTRQVDLAGMMEDAEATRVNRNVMPLSDTTRAAIPVPQERVPNTDPIPPLTADAPPNSRQALRTVVGVPAVQLGMPVAQAPAAAPKAQNARTMLGVPDVPYGVQQALASVQAAPAAPAPANAPHAHATMVAGAFTPPNAGPGQAPAQASGPAPNMMATTPAPVPRKVPNAMATMLGGAVPIQISNAQASNPPAGQFGQASSPPAQPQIQTGFTLPPYVPAPDALELAPLPARPVVVAKRSFFSAPVVVGSLLAVTLVAGGAALMLLRKGPQLTAKASVDESGRDIVNVQCETCPDGTTLSIGAASATFQGNRAALRLDTPLMVGHNPLMTRIDRPGNGRDEEVKLVVPVEYRIRVDGEGLEKWPPAFLVNTEKASDVQITLDGKRVEGPVTTIDLGAIARGSSESVATFERSIPYQVSSVSRPLTASGTLVLKTRVLPLRIDSPRNGEWVAGSSVTVDGQAAPGSRVTVNDVPATVDPQGVFSAVAPQGSIEIRVFRKDAASRSTTIETVLAPDGERKKTEREFEAKAQLSLDDVSKDVAGNAGKGIVLDAEIVEARASAKTFILLADVKKGCQKNCLVRVMASRNQALTRGDSVRIWGHVARSVRTGDDRTIVEVEAASIAKRKL